MSTQIPIVYQDSEIFIINKRAGLPVQGGSGITHSVDTDLADQTGQKIYLVHRLDKETSGLLVCAKSPAAAFKWTSLIGQKSVVKEYKALVVGCPPQKKGRLSFPITERGVQKSAETFYRLLSTKVAGQGDVEGGGCGRDIELSLLALTLGTGRMHQIRIHLAKAGLPICGDDKHGDFKANKILKKALGIKRLCLCAYRLTVPLATGPATFEVPCEFDVLL